jgi:Fic family protein
VELARPDPVQEEITEETYLQHVEAIRVEDAYHSLSIERYRVTPELIRKIAERSWSPETNPADKQHTEALAAKGYLDAFSLVKADAGQAFSQRNQNKDLASRIFANRHQTWFQKLFSASVDAGILEQRDLVGYRRHMVFLRGSQHSPPHYDYVRDGMEALKECFAAEPDAFARAVLGHWLFGFIHPYMDGNGRMARFLMNLMLASGGYPWTVIRVEDRAEYMAGLEQASVGGNIQPFADFISSCVRKAQAR